MAELDAIAQRLRAEGRAAATGGFTLDAERAREKLRQFQLADPHRYVLLMVQALAVRGATAVHARVDTSSLTLESDAQPFSFEELSELYPLLFSERAPPPGLRELALALNAAMALNPRSAVLECGAADASGVRLEQRVGRDDVIERATGITPGVRLVVRERFRPGLVLRFFALGSNVVREQVLLVTRCAHAGIDVRVNDVSVPPWQFPPDCAWAHDVTLGGRAIGRIALAATGGPGEIEIVRHHVWLATHRFEAPELACIRGALDASHLRTDASMADVVQDQHYQELLAAIAAARDAALSAMASELAAAPPDAVPTPLRDLLCLRLGQHLAAGGDPQAPLAQAGMALRLWPCLDGRRRSTAEVTQQLPFGFVPSRIFEQPSPAERATMSSFAHVPQLGDSDRAAFTAVFGDQAVNLGPLLRRAAIREGNLRAWRARPLEPRLEPDAYALLERFDEGGFTGEIGQVRDPVQDRSWLRIVVDGCMLVQISIDLPDAPHHVVVTGTLTPNETYDDVVRDDAFAACMRVVLAAYHRIARTLAQRHGDGGVVDLETLFEHAHATNTPAGLRRVLASVGMRAPQLQAVLDDRAAPWRFDVASASATSPHPLATLPLFQDAAGNAVDLRAIAESFARDGQVRVISRQRPRLAHAPTLVVRASERGLALLQALFGDDAVKRVGREFEHWIARDEFFASAAVPTPWPTNCSLGPLRFGDDTVTGEVAIVAGAAAAADTELELRVDGRVLTHDRLPFRIGNMRVAVEIPDAWVLPTWDGVQPGRRDAVRRCVALALAAVCEALVAAGDALAPQLAHAVLAALAHAMPRPEHVDAWIAFGTDPGPTARAQTYAELLRLVEHHDPARVYQSLARTVANGVAPLPATVAHGLPRRPASPDRVTTAALGCADHLERLMELPVISTTRGRSLTFAEVAAAAIAERRWRYVASADAADVPTDFDEAGIVDEPMLAPLSSLLGSRLVDAAPELQRAARRRAFESAPVLEDLAIPPGLALVSAVIEDPEFRGELGLPPVLPGVTVERAMVTICTRGRPVTSVQPVPGTPWIGVIDTRDFGSESDYTRLTSIERVRVTSICRAHRARLARAIAAAWNPAGRDAAMLRAWALQLMTELLPEGDVSDRALANAGLRELASVAFFVDADLTPRTLADLRTRLRPGGVLPLVRLPGLRADSWLPMARDDAEYRALAGLFRRVEDSQPLVLARLELERLERSGPPLPRPPGDALVIATIDGRDLSGCLWLTAEPDGAKGIVLGRSGKALSTWRGSTLFPCAGALEGEGIETAADWSGCELSRTRAAYVKGRAAGLYVELVEDLRRAPLSIDDRRTEVLRALLLRLGEFPRAGRSWPSHVARRLFRDLRDLPLLPLANGHAIAWTTAQRERPQELASLGLWREGDAAVADVEEASVEEAEPSPAAAANPNPGPVEPAPVVAPSTASMPTDATATEAVHEPPAAHEPRPPSPEQRLLAAVLQELRMLRSGDHPGPADVHLELIEVRAIDGRRVVRWQDARACIDARHPLVGRALATDAEPLLTSLIASAAVTVLNLALDDVTDEQEARWLAAHAAYLRTAAGRDHDEASARPPSHA